MAPDSGLYLGEHERKSVYAGKMAAGNAMANMALFDAAGNANSALLHMKTM